MQGYVRQSARHIKGAKANTEIKRHWYGVVDKVVEKNQQHEKQEDCSPASQRRFCFLFLLRLNFYAGAIDKLNTEFNPLPLLKYLFCFY